MSISISGVFPESSAVVPSPLPTVISVTPVTENADEDTVTLSQAAQVGQLNVQGVTPAQIAEKLGIPISDVDIDLGIAATTQTVPVVGAHPATAPGPASTPTAPASATPTAAPPAQAEATQVSSSPAVKSAPV